MADTFVQLFSHHTAGLIAPVRNKQFQQGVEQWLKSRLDPFHVNGWKQQIQGSDLSPTLPLRLGRGT
jgi:hypothetical protein